MEVSDQLHVPAALATGKEPLVPIGVWMGPRAALGTVVNKYQEDRQICITKSFIIYTLHEILLLGQRNQRGGTEVGRKILKLS
jgi:hypothetical protein